MILIDQSLDEKIILALQRIRFPLLNLVMVLFTWTAQGRVWVTVAVSFHLINHFHPIFSQDFLNAFYAPLLVWAMNKFLKKKFKRDRPGVVNSKITPLVKSPPCFSFPSSHSGSTFAFALTLLWWGFPGAGYFLLWAMIVSFSRMYLGVHFLTDILAGVLVGLLSSGIIYFIF